MKFIFDLTHFSVHLRQLSLAWRACVGVGVGGHEGAFSYIELLIKHLQYNSMKSGHVFLSSNTIDGEFLIREVRHQK